MSLKRIGKQRAVDETSQLAEGSAGGLIHIVFDGLHALAQVDTTGQDTIKVSYADAWAKSRRLDTAAGGRNGATAGTTSVIETVKNYDWTYSTTYSGTLEGKEVSLVCIVASLGFLTSLSCHTRALSRSPSNLPLAIILAYL